MTTALIEPCTPIECSGSPFALGEAQGKQVGAQVRAAYDALAGVDEFCARKPAYLPFRLYRLLAARKAEKHIAKAVADQSRAMFERLQGVAAGADIAPAAVWLMNGMEAILASMEGTHVPAPMGGCSALAVRGSRSADGEPILAHNFDYLPIVQPFFIMRETRPEDGFRSLEFTVAPLAGTIDGMNEKGLVIAYNYGQTRDHGKPGPTISMRISEVLSRCATVPEALDELCTKSRWGSGLLMLMDASGDMAALELTNTREGVRRPANGDDVLFHTNCFQCPNTQQVEVPRDAVFDRFTPECVRGIKVLESPIQRFHRLETLLASSAQLTPNDLTEIMSDHGADGQPSLNSVCMHHEHWVTSASFQWFPSSGKVRVSFSKTCEAQYVDLSL